MTSKRNFLTNVDVDGELSKKGSPVLTEDDVLAWMGDVSGSLREIAAILKTSLKPKRGRADDLGPDTHG